MCSGNSRSGLRHELEVAGLIALRSRRSSEPSAVLRVLRRRRGPDTRNERNTRDEEEGVKVSHLGFDVA